jgi:hypothetical protein
MTWSCIEILEKVNVTSSGDEYYGQWLAAA